jgi:predicted Zn-dependent protease
MKKAFLLYMVCGVVLASCGTTRRMETTDVSTPVDTVSESPMQRKYDYFFLEAMRQKAQDRQAETFALLQHCLAINPNGASAIYELSAYYAGMGDSDKTVQCLRRAVELAPDNYWYQLALVNTYLRKNEHVEQAEEVLEQMTQRFPDKLQPLYALLDVYNAQGKNQDVIDLLNRLEVKTGKNEQLTMEKFRVYMQMKDNKNALHEIVGLV